MKSLDRFKLKMSLLGNSLREESIKNSQELLKDVFEDDVSIATGVYFWKLGKKSYEDEEPLTIRIYKRAFSSANGVQMSFQTLIDNPVIVGDVLYDSESNEYLICTESFDMNGVHWKGKLTLCNWILRWQNEFGDILEYPCHDINTTQYNSGEQSNKQFTIGSSQHMVTLPYDENTVALKTPKRFFLDRDFNNPSCFIVTQNDTTSYSYGKKGLVKVTVMECAVNYETDRIDLGICDYIDNDNDNTEEDSSDSSFVSKSVISYKTNVIKSGGDPQSFYAKFFDENGFEVGDISAKWDIICDFKDALNVNENENENCITISVDDDALVDEEFKLSLSDSDGKYESSIIVRIESLL